DDHTGRVMFTRSDDDGKTWTPAAAVARVPAQVFTPTITVAGDGTVGVGWFDFRNDRPGDSQLTTDYWFADSRDRGATWRQTHVAGPFDYRSAPDSNSGRFLGDYMGLVALSDGFGTIF